MLFKNNNNENYAKIEFHKWLNQLDKTHFNETDTKLINLLTTNFDSIYPLSTASGRRAKMINALIQEKNKILPITFPNISVMKKKAQIFERLSELKIGPFRGFTTAETFTFDKKYTFLYGPNGSGKSSFCDGLEFALLGTIEEATAKRIPLNDYIINTKVKKGFRPFVYGLNANDEKVIIPQNQELYRFSFIEKNRIDGFARISATTLNVQKDKIATLFGLNDFSDFVDGFTNHFENYLELENVKEKTFKEEQQKNELDRKRLTVIKEELTANIEKLNKLITEFPQKGINTKEELEILLIGNKDQTGIIQKLQNEQNETIPIDIDLNIFRDFYSSYNALKEELQELNNDLDELSKLSSDVDYKNLYTAICSLATNSDTVLDHCPACKTPIEKVTINPYDHAKEELKTLKTLSVLQNRISKGSISISTNVRKINTFIQGINNYSIKSGNLNSSLCLFSEFNFEDFSTINSWKAILTKELQNCINQKPVIWKIIKSIIRYNIKLKSRRKNLKLIEKELNQYISFNKRLEAINTKDEILLKEKETIDKRIIDFQDANKTKLDEIEQEKQKIIINKQYLDSYNKVINKLIEYRDLLPSKLSSGLSEKAKEYYNVINAHDPEFEKIKYLSLPTKANDRIEIKFINDTESIDILLVLSEGHIKVLGLAILLSKVVQENLGFLVFDDICGFH